MAVWLVRVRTAEVELQVSGAVRWGTCGIHGYKEGGTISKGVTDERRVV